MVNGISLVETSSANGTGGSYWPLQPNWPRRQGFDFSIFLGSAISTYYYIILYYIILYCIILYYIILHYIILCLIYIILLYYIILNYIILYYYIYYTI